MNVCADCKYSSLEWDFTGEIQIWLCMSPEARDVVRGHATKCDWQRKPVADNFAFERCGPAGDWFVKDDE